MLPVIYFERGSPKYRKVLWKRQRQCTSASVLSSDITADWSGMQKRRILIVDNNDELRAILEKVLGSLGREAVVTGDRDEASAGTTSISLI